MFIMLPKKHDRDVHKIKPTYMVKRCKLSYLPTHS
uniref:Uncharacterized protein n=1 Tax=Arundo donax TaxID=35708 RepID=A0A0A8ZZW5_ARUDO